MFEKIPYSPHTTPEGAVNLAEQSYPDRNKLLRADTLQDLQHHHDDLPA
jgi:hypothetical protein